MALFPLGKTNFRGPLPLRAFTSTPCRVSTPGPRVCSGVPYMPENQVQILCVRGRMHLSGERSCTSQELPTHL